MSDEENKVIDRLKQTIDFNSFLYIDDLGDNDIKIILNVIDKQQKEIEELRKYIQKYKIRIPMPEEYCNRESWGEEITIAQKEYISKDKIREKIKELNDLESNFFQKLIEIARKTGSLTEMTQNILKELLEEN